MKKLIKPVLILLGILAVIFGFYVYKLHALEVEGDKIFEFRCTDVNPPLISYKNSFLKWADMMQNPGKYKDSDFITFYTGYIDGIKKYIPEEDKWLKMQKNFINRWDFKLIEPWYLKQASVYQLQMYQDYRDDAQSKIDLLNISDPKNQTLVNETMDKGSKIRDKQIQDSNTYFDFFDKASAIKDWRKAFEQVPPSKVCNDDNMTIPTTQGAINWDGTPTPMPKAKPGQEDTSG